MRTNQGPWADPVRRLWQRTGEKLSPSWQEIKRDKFPSPAVSDGINGGWSPRQSLLRHSGEGRNLPPSGMTRIWETPAFAGVTLIEEERTGPPPTPLASGRGDSFYATDNAATSTFTPGPIELESATLRTYLPLEPDGFALTIASTKASKFFLRSSWLKLILPSPA